MALDAEKDRILRFVLTEKDRVLPIIDRAASDRSQIALLAELARTIFSALENSLEQKIHEIVQLEAAALPDVASEKIQGLFTAVQISIAWLASAAEDQANIPRELYRLVEWYLSRCPELPTQSVILRLSPSELSTTEFGEFSGALFKHGSTSLLPELEAAISKPFYFIQIPTFLAPESASIDWPLIFHECCHIIEHTLNHIGKQLPQVPRSWTELNAQVKAGIPEAQQALKLEELACDYAAVQASGPGYAWSFVRRFSAICGVFQPTQSHPRFDVRLECLRESMAKNGFTDEAELLQKHLEDMLEGYAAPGPEILHAHSTKTLELYAASMTAYTKASFDTAIALTGGSVASLRRDLRDLRPVLLDPAALFSLTSFFEPAFGDPIVGELLADMVRLERIQSDFLRLGLYG